MKQDEKWTSRSSPKRTTQPASSIPLRISNITAPSPIPIRLPTRIRIPRILIIPIIQRILIPIIHLLLQRPRRRPRTILLRPIHNPTLMTLP